jgi:hypothetical protein
MHSPKGTQALPTEQVFSPLKKTSSWLFGLISPQSFVQRSRSSFISSAAVQRALWQKTK